MSNKIIVSACLAGIHCRYDCASKENQEIVDLVASGDAIPVCPEQLGGLPTPRPPAEQQDDKVISVEGKDVTEEYNRGAQEAYNIAKISGADEAILKSKSPMCGCGEIYDGSFQGKLIKGDGVFAKLLKSHGIKVRSR